MSFINSIIKVFVGNKSEKDVKALQANVTKIKAFEITLAALSNCPVTTASSTSVLA